MPALDYTLLNVIVKSALEEDIGPGDVTCEAVIPRGEEVDAEIIAREECVIAGQPVARVVFTTLDPQIHYQPDIPDGSAAAQGVNIAHVTGSAHSILMAERTALNFLQHLSGIATLTRKFVELTKESGVTILDTRKTLPGLRHLQKYAVAVGGATNHRMGLYDRVMIKDNHLRIQERFSADPVGRAIALAQESHPGDTVMVEADSLEAVEAALRAGAGWILLDNMSPDMLRDAAALINGNATAEATGGITLDNIAEVAETGIDYISIGFLTHSVKAVDLSLKIL